MAPVILPRPLDELGRHARTRSRSPAVDADAEAPSADRRASPGSCSCPRSRSSCFVAIYPLARTVYQSFTNQEFLAGLTPTKWVGLENYRTLIHDTIFRDTVVLTIKFTVITVSLSSSSA